MIGRRGFLKVLGAAPVVGPSLATQASQGISGAMGLAGIATNALPAAPSTPAIADTDPVSHENVYKKALLWLKGNRLPQWAIDEIRDEERYPSSLDPDLAVARSFSLSTKIRVQRERNIKLRTENIIPRHERRQTQRLWQKATGLEFWT